MNNLYSEVSQNIEMYCHTCRLQSQGRAWSARTPPARSMTLPVAVADLLTGQQKADPYLPLTLPQAAILK